MRDVVVKVLSIMLAPSEATRRQRHTLGAMILILVVVLVIVGSLFLSVGASPGTSLLWWGICFLLIVWSVYLAYLDVRSLRHELRAQRKQLFFSVFSNRREQDSDKKKSSRLEGQDKREPGGEESDPSGCR